MGNEDIPGVIETIARGVCVVDGKVLLCRGKGLKSTYLPGGHIEFGEKGAEALVREMKEETGLDAVAGKLLGVVENSFLQKGQRHCEINLVYEMSLKDAGTSGYRSSAVGCHAGPHSVDPLAACEDWIEFEWRPISDLASANLLPGEMAKYIKE